MSWYKLSQNADQALSKIISQWLMQSYRGPVDLKLVQQDIDSVMPYTDERAIETALISGETMARNQLRQNGALTQYQQELINNIRMRLTVPQIDKGQGYDQEAFNQTQEETNVEDQSL